MPNKNMPTSIKGFNPTLFLSTHPINKKSPASYTTTTLRQVAKLISSDVKLKRFTLQIRKCDSKEERNKIKKQLYSVISSNTEGGMRDSSKFNRSNLIIFDVDKLSSTKLKQLKTTLKKDKRVALLYISPSGKGLRFIYHLSELVTDYMIYSTLYNKIRSNLISKYTLLTEQNLDHTCSAVNAFFLSYDSDVYLNSTTEPINISKRY